MKFYPKLQEKLYETDVPKNFPEYYDLEQDIKHEMNEEQKT